MPERAISLSSGTLFCLPPTQALVVGALFDYLVEPKPKVLYVGLRELVKCMYLIPIAGWAVGLVSVVLLFVKGTTLHDMAGGTKVIFRWEEEDLEEAEKAEEAAREQP